ncbi:MAG: glycosyl hydrolase, partial [Gemmatimonadetes bacterium]|nr:glycosyl hydrolase [Gemmatimonadota bacterium]
MPQARGSRTARYWIAVLGVAVLASGIPAGSISGQAVVDTSLLAGMKYRSIGPARGGRVTAVAGLVSEPLSYFMGSTGGGVWRTDDAGASWRNVSDGQFGAASVGAIAVADSDPNVVWVGMGSACIRGNTSQGDGVYRSLDGGKSWTHSGLPEAGQIGRIAVDPRNPDVAFVAALGHPFGPNSERGVYRTRDGGAEWENVLFVSDSTGAVDLALNPANPRIIYAGMW